MARSQGAFYEQLGKRIRKARDAAKATQEELAGVVRLTRTSITNIERGRQPVTAHVLVQIASALNASVVDLLPSTDAPVTTRKVKSKLRRLEEPQREWVERIITS